MRIYSSRLNILCYFFQGFIILDTNNGTIFSGCDWERFFSGCDWERFSQGGCVRNRRTPLSYAPGERQKTTFLLKKTLFFLNKNIFYSWRLIFFKIPRNLIASAFSLAEADTKKTDMPRQKP